MSRPDVKRQAEDEMERQAMDENERALLRLNEQLERVKAASLEIHGEAVAQNSLLDGMGEVFDRVQTGLEKTIDGIGTMMKTGTLRERLGLVAAMFVAMWVVYYLAYGGGAGAEA